MDLHRPHLGSRGAAVRSGSCTALRAVAALALGAACVAHARVTETQFAMPVQVQDAFGKRIEQPMVVTVFDDDAVAGPKPVIVINHGRAGEAAERAGMGRARFADISRWFARNGFIVALPTRIGYGATGGEDVESSGSCASRRYEPGYEAAATEVLAALDKVRERPDALKDHGIVLGQSYGGMTSVAIAARNPAGVDAVINFAGGGGGDPKQHPQRPCSPVQLERLFGTYGERARVPMLWVYTENDQYWGPALPHAWFDRFRQGGGVAEFVGMPPAGDDGHHLFAKFPDRWRPVVADFLKRHGHDMKELP